jgi:RNase P/RNase MRP subunit p30
MADRVKALRGCFRESGLEVFLRADLTCSKRAELLKLLRRFRSVFDIISVKCTNHIIALVAARDRRVDLIFFDPAKRNVWFDHSIANVSHATLELNTSVLFVTNDHVVVTRMMKDVSTARRHRLHVVLSSGCTSPFLVRAPTQMSAIGMVLGLSEEEARMSVSTIPSRIVKTNLERGSRTYVEEGVKVIGTD